MKCYLEHVFKSEKKERKKKEVKLWNRIHVLDKAHF